MERSALGPLPKVMRALSDLLAFLLWSPFLLSPVRVRFAFPPVPASPLLCALPSRRGMRIDDFVDLINRQVNEDGRKSGISSPPLLTTNEVISLRLYTGPAYAPINVFLREVAKVGPEWRRQLARYHKLTYAATVGHLYRCVRSDRPAISSATTLNLLACHSLFLSLSLTHRVMTSGLRKLVRVSTKIQRMTLYRGVRGELPAAFWLKDPFGEITATDFAFMSTSEDELVTHRFLSSKSHNVIWEIKCSEEDDVGFHAAADISPISQYPEEREVLFPPLTMLQVSCNTAGEPIQTEETTAYGAKFTRIVVQPTFV